jgi:dTDP-4-amino-4,6-dideoxygalactose transaminase
VIYDAAHAFGVKDQQGSILRYGDLSVLSFHATKVFNTFEGGAIISPDAKTKRHIDHLKNFGFVDETTVVAAGINSKMSELNAAVGLLQLKHIDHAIKRRREIDAIYRKAFSTIKGIRCIDLSNETVANYSYFPILIGKDFVLSRDEVFNKLCEQNIYARRYFYPLISEFPMYRGLRSASPDNLPVARMVADQVLCLPIYPNLEPVEQHKIINLIRSH